ncbi:MAG: hypothetical protein ACI8W3_000496 [Myxococcota bacterium]|jgi:hypothetical protein
MAKEYEPEELASKIFYLSIGAIGAFIAVVFIFIL